jgi:hypothetical protein
MKKLVVILMLLGLVSCGTFPNKVEVVEVTCDKQSCKCYVIGKRGTLGFFKEYVECDSNINVGDTLHLVKKY